MRHSRQISVGGVPIGGGAPVVVQSMTTTKTHDVDATLAQVERLVDAGCEIVRVAVPGIPDADALPVAGARRRRADHRRHPLQRLAGAARDGRGRRGGAHQPRQHRRRRQGALGGRARPRDGHAAAHRRQRRLAAGAPALDGHRRPRRRARAGGDGGGRAARAPRLPRLQDLRQVVERARDDRRLPAPRGDGRLPAAPRRDRGRHAAHGRGEVGRSASARCSRTASATRSASRSRPTRSRRCASRSTSCAPSACASSGPS